MSVTSRKAVSGIKITGGIILACIALTLGVIPVLGPCWHLLHGNTVSFQGWPIRVPSRFFAKETSRGITMWKLDVGTPLFDVAYGQISFFYRSGEHFDFDRHYRSFADGVAQEAREGGYGISETSLDSRIYCLQLERQSQQPRAMARCAVEGTGVAIFYEGDAKYLPDFNSTLQGFSNSVGAGK